MDYSNEMNLVSVHKQSQEQLEELKVQLMDSKHKAHDWEAQFKRSKKKQQVLLSELEALKAQLAKREQQLFGRKTEKSRNYSEKSTGKAETKKRRGQQPGSTGHGRRDHNHLPEVKETYDVSEKEKLCPCCSLPYEALKTTEDSTIVEIINVQGYIRKIRRKKYTRSCQCKEAPRFIDAPPAPRLIPKCRYGVSVWAYLLLQKYEYHPPLNRALNQLSKSGISLASGTVTDGFKKLLPLLLPVYDAIVERSLSENHWHADEIGWKVFVDSPDVPMDNNKAENSLRHGVLGKNSYYGSGAVWSSALTAVMFTLFRTFALEGIHLHTWLLTYFQECAAKGGQPPDNIDRFLPWNMTEEQKARLTEPPVGETPFTT